MVYSPQQLAYFAHKLTLRGPADSMDRIASALLDAQRTPVFVGPACTGRADKLQRQGDGPPRNTTLSPP